MKRGTVQIMNLSGVRIFNRDVDDGCDIDISAFAPGVYLFQGEGLGMQKFIKQ